MTLEKNCSPRKLSSILDNGSSSSTRASTIFGAKELNIIYQNNSLECLPEGDSIYSEESQLSSSKSIVCIKSGLMKLNKFFEKKHFSDKIESLYRLMTYHYQDTNRELDKNTLKCDIQKEEKQDFLTNIKQSLTSRKANRHIKSMAFDCHFNDEISKIENKSEISHDEGHYNINYEFESDKDYALGSIRCSMTSEKYHHDEKEILLFSNLGDSLLNYVPDELSVDSETFLIKLENIEKQQNILDLEEHQEPSCNDFNLMNKYMSSKQSSSGSEDTFKLRSFKKKNDEDLNIMARQLEEIRKIVFS